MVTGMGAPAPAGQGRRYVAAAIDLTLAGSVGLLAGLFYVAGFYTAGLAGEDVPGLTDPRLLLRIAAGALAMSFINQVLLALATRRSIGKLCAGTCLARTADGKWPGPWRVLLRWIAGITYASTIAPLDILTSGPGLAPDDFTGVRIVLRPGLRTR
ncbi:hypothetical protein B7P34_25580 [Streptosporangium nondiastaticum]|uniref:RDD domain-containing protein n=1 Tax=Streptosporangium nondiastaticum TaxID=35764 RepID=A0A9X7JLF0_9ACTN|nr:RDD family protein [Streptosporangium nondiastaticum]PSJ25924.1 hypothetical protein B7P34_25580 [Streptosporangium nondiastaticum]